MKNKLVSIILPYISAALFAQENLRPDVPAAIVDGKTVMPGLIDAHMHDAQISEIAHKNILIVKRLRIAFGPLMEIGHAF